MNIQRLLLIGMLFFSLTDVAQAQSRVYSNPPVQLIFPVSCRLEENCWLVNYPDIDLGEGLKDYNGGNFTYNGSMGTEIAIQSLVQMKKGVPVVAALGGRVVFTMDGEEDNLPLSGGADSQEKPFCGNSVVLEHSTGWQTVYCHLKKGSITVKKGNFVNQGNKIAEVGASGRTDFPNLYFSVLGDEESFDPFTGKQLSMKKEEETEKAGIKPKIKQYMPFWSPVIKDKLLYRSVAVVNVGVSPEDPIIDKVKEGEYEDVKLQTDTGTIDLWMYGFHFGKGDFVKASLQSPVGGKIFSEMKSINSDELEKVVFFRVPKPANDWKAGKYRGSFAFMRPGSKYVYNYTTSFEMKDPPVPIDEEALRKEQIKKQVHEKKMTVGALRKLYQMDKLPAQFKNRPELIKRLKGNT